MYDDTVIPVISKFRVPSQPQSRIYFVENKTKNSLFFIKWIELVLGLLCLCFIVVAINSTEVPKVPKILVLAANISGILIVFAEITYSYFIRSFPWLMQVLCSLANFVTFTIATTQIYGINNDHELIKTVYVLNGLAAIIFLADCICRILISTYLYQITRVKSVVDVGVNVEYHPPPPVENKPRFHPQRSILTTTPITYGGTFPVGKDQPPFLAEEKISPNDGHPDRGIRSRKIQPPLHLEGQGSFYSVYPCAKERISRSKFVQTYLERDEKGTTNVPLPQHFDEERRKKSPWTCSSPNSSRKFDARKQASLSTPITYSGTFAVNKELVPVTLSTVTGSSASPKNSPGKDLNPDKPFRKNSTISRSEGNSPIRSENIFLELERLDHISEEKISQCSENSSVKRSYTYFEPTILPGSVIEEDDQYDQRSLNYFSR